ncbi:hypothetical protein TNCV_3744801 [Trichonephila clavipes]|nr:hypothetical protein TNCV_3744801 [Trichonephila clavipes]
MHLGERPSNLGEKPPHSNLGDNNNSQVSSKSVGHGALGYILIPPHRAGGQAGGAVIPEMGQHFQLVKLLQVFGKLVRFLPWCNTKRPHAREMGNVHRR